jgi:hypothetical protein
MSTARGVSLIKLGWQVWAVLVSVLALVLLAGVFALTW